MTNEFVNDQGEQIIGHEHVRFNSYLTALALFILVGNLMGLVPGWSLRRPMWWCRWALH